MDFNQWVSNDDVYVDFSSISIVMEIYIYNIRCGTEDMHS